MAKIPVGIYVVEGQGGAVGSPIKGALVASEELSSSSGASAQSAISTGTTIHPGRLAWSVYNSGTAILYATCSTNPTALATGANMRSVAPGATEVWRCEVANEKIAVIDES